MVAKKAPVAATSVISKAPVLTKKRKGSSSSDNESSGSDLDDRKPTRPPPVVKAKVEEPKQVDQAKVEASKPEV